VKVLRTVAPTPEQLRIINDYKPGPTLIRGATGSSGGMPPAGAPTRGRYLYTLVRVNGRWLIASYAATATPRPPAKAGPPQ
jgi:hypothetical protein